MSFLHENLVVIHLSSTAVCTVVASQSACKTRVEIMGVGIAETNSFVHGEIVNRDRLITAIKKSIRNAEEMSNLRIESAVVCFGTPKMYSGNSVGNIFVQDVVDYDAMAAVLANAKSAFVPNDHYLVGFSSQAYWINDGDELVETALDRTGVHKLGANYHLMTLPLSNLNHLYSVFGVCDVKPDMVVFEVLAGAHYALIDEERERGALFVDIGAKSTNFCVYIKNKLIHSETIAIGSDFITHTIANRLKISYIQAEHLKRYHASLTVGAEDRGEFIDIGNDGNQSVVNRALLSQAVQVGFEEIFGQVDESLKKANILASFATSGIVLAGEGSQIKNIISYLKTRYELSVHLVNDASRESIVISKRLDDAEITSLSVLLKERRLRTALGAMLYCFNEDSWREYRNHLGNEKNAPETGLWNKVKSYLKRLTNG